MMSSAVVDINSNLTRFKELLLRSCGHRFENEREQTLATAVRRRITALGVNGHDDYFALLQRDDSELLRLTELLTVNETYFFREPDHLNLMVDKLLPEFIAARNGRPVRILSAGCSTGEEPYSIAIMLRERFGADSERLFAITGVDIDSSVIAAARQGVFGNSSFRGMDKAILVRYFKPSGPGKLQVENGIKKLVEFEVVNLLNSSYPQKMQEPDIILYRNVSIYFPGQVQREIFGRLAQLLAEGGCLLVGAAETIHHDIGILSLVKKDSLFFYRKTPPLVFAERRISSRHASNAEQVGKRPLQATPGYSPMPEVQQIRTQDAGYARPLKQPPVKVPPDVKERFDEAIQLVLNKQYENALAVLDGIINQDSSFKKAYGLKGSLLLHVARFDESRTVCESILAQDPLSLEAYLMLGMIARQNGNNDEAFRRFREASYLKPTCWLAHFYTAELLYAQRDLKRARSSYETSLKILDKGGLKEQEQAFFPLTFNAEQFIVISRHKLSLLVTQLGAFTK